MKIYITLAFLVFLSFQVQGMDNKNNQEIQTNTKYYFKTIQVLKEISESYMEKTEVNGRDYSELVLDKIYDVNRLQYVAENQIQHYYIDYMNYLNASVNNQVNRFMRTDKENGQFFGKIIKREFLCRKAEEQKELQILSLKAYCAESREQVSNFYNVPLTYLEQRNDTYVDIYFSLRYLKNTLTSFIDQNNSQDILSHFQKVESCLNDLGQILNDTQGDSAIAFKGYRTTFEQEIDVRGELQLFRYSMAEELLTGELFSNLRLAIIDLRSIALSII